MPLQKLKWSATQSARCSMNGFHGVTTTAPFDPRHVRKKKHRFGGQVNPGHGISRSLQRCDALVDGLQHLALRGRVRTSGPDKNLDIVAASHERIERGEKMALDSDRHRESLFHSAVKIPLAQKHWQAFSSHRFSNLEAIFFSFKLR